MSAQISGQHLLLPAPATARLLPLSGVEPVRIAESMTGKRRVLLVDDEVEFLNAIEETMERRARGIYETVKAHRVEEALDIFMQRRFQAVITDLNVLGRRGDVLARQLKEIDRQIPVILITANVNDINPALIQYLNSVVPKPLDTEHLMNLLWLCVNQPT